MARDLSTANATQAQAETVRPILFAELDFAGGVVRAHTGIGNIVWGGYTWGGVGNFADVGDVEEGVDVAARGLVLTLAGVPSSLLTEALAANYRGRSAKLFLGFLNTSGALVDTPYQTFGGRMDVLGLEDGGDTCSISVQCENRLVDFRRSRASRYTHEDQRARFPADMGLQYIARIADQTIHWGAPNPATSAMSASSSRATRTSVVATWK